MKILVIGGAGYIGSVVVENLVNKTQNEVVIFDDLSTGYEDLINPKAKFVMGSQLDYQKLSRTMKEEKIELVIALAAKIVVSESVSQPGEYYEINIQGTNNILKAMVENNVKNIIFSSSAATYGIPKKNPISENDPQVPCNPYGESKLVCEWLIKDFKKAYGINYLIFRFFNVGGASDSGKYGMYKKDPTLLIPSISKALITNNKIKVFGKDYKTKDGTCVRDYIHVEDLANAHLKGVEWLSNGMSSEIFNLGSGTGSSVMDIIRLIDRSLGIKKPPYEIFPRRAGDPDKLITNNARAKKVFNWKPQKKLADLLKSDYKFRKTKKLDI